MIDYSDIPIYLRISDRWLIDPDYTAVRYHGREQLIEKSKVAGAAWARRIVPESILAYLYELSHFATDDVVQTDKHMESAAVAMQILPRDLDTAMHAYRKRLRKAKGKGEVVLGDGECVISAK